MSLRSTLRPLLSALETPFLRHTPVGMPPAAATALLQRPSTAALPTWTQPAALFDELFNHLGQAAFPAVSVEDKGNGYEILADLAGYTKDDVKVRLADANRRLILEGETKTAEVVDEPLGGQAGGRTAADVDAGKAETTRNVIQHGGEDAMVDPNASDEVAREANQALAQAAAAKQPANGWLIDERARYSAFRRALAFDAPLDPASISARMADGQLKVTVAKQGEGGEGLVDVKVE